MKVRALSLPALAAVTLGLALATPAAAQESYGPLCQSRSVLCRDPSSALGLPYVGHDEPAVVFQSDRSGTGGRNLQYTLKLPKNPPIAPKRDGSGGIWDFQLRATFWLGLTLCDTESAPEFTKTCNPNTDANARFTSADPASPFYIGKHPGNAFMELQFYEPGWVPQFDGFGCTATQWCANLTIDSLSLDQNTGIPNNAACDDLTLGGLEPVQWAFVTRSGRAQAPANPIATNNNPAALNPDPAKVLLMNSGDTIRVLIHDTAAGIRTDLVDLTTGGRGSMTASVANGFGHLLYEPNSSVCHMRPYAFHPEYNTASTRGNTWSAHFGNVSFSDEIGHFEHCLKITQNGGDCIATGANDPTLDDDDFVCLDGALYPGAVPIIGCVAADGDWDGPSYRLDWPGVFPNQTAERTRIPTPVQFTVPTSGGRPVERVSFETDLPAIEGGEPASRPPFCDQATGANCVNPPHGARFDPIYTAAHSDIGCVLQQGGTHLPGTFNTFGGTSTTEYGGLLAQIVPRPGPVAVTRFANFRRDLGTNPCAGQ